MTEEEIQLEVDARVRFKMNEFLTGIRNLHKLSWATDISHRGYAQREVYEVLEERCIKEIDMATPYDYMAKRQMDVYRNVAVDKLLRLIDGRKGYDNNKVRSIVSVVEDAQRWMSPKF